jgi:hypothetical protein
VALAIHGRCGWWGEAMHKALWSPDGASGRPAAVFLGPEGANAGSLSLATERARPWLGRRDAGLVPLLAIELVGAHGAQRLAWVYEDSARGSLGALAGAEPIPRSVATLIVARCAEVVEPFSAVELHHTGPAREDVLVDAEGSVAVARFVSPLAGDPSRREPRGAVDARAQVWRLGVLLAEILTGQTAPPIPDRAAHDRAIRRLLVRVMAEPGPSMSERYRDWLCSMLAWDADERPLLNRVGPGLRELAGGEADEALRRWCAERVPQMRRAAREETNPLDPQAEAWDPAYAESPAPSLEPTVEISALPLTDDDSTETSGVDDAAAELIAEPGAIPVQVGPPPEAMVRAPRLPSELALTDLASRPKDSRPGSPLTIALSAALLAAAAALAGYLVS